MLRCRALFARYRVVQVWIPGVSAPSHTIGGFKVFDASGGSLGKVIQDRPYSDDGPRPPASTAAADKVAAARKKLAEMQQQQREQLQSPPVDSDLI